MQATVHYAMDVLGVFSLLILPLNYIVSVTYDVLTGTSVCSPPT